MGIILHFKPSSPLNIGEPLQGFGEVSPPLRVSERAGTGARSCHHGVTDLKHWVLTFIYEGSTVDRFFLEQLSCVCIWQAELCT